LPAARGAELIAQETGITIDEKWNVNDNRAIRGHLDHLLDANAVRASLEVGARSQRKKDDGPRMNRPAFTEDRFA
jgi:hypothetical protein